MSLRDKILSPDNPSTKLKREPVTLCGHPCFAWELSSLQRDRFEAAARDARESAKSAPGSDGLRALLVSMGTRETGEDNAPFVFVAGDVGMYLNKLPASQLDPVASAILRLSGMDRSAVEDAKKNSEPTPGDASSSASPTVAAGPASSGASPTPAPQS